MLLSNPYFTLNYFLRPKSRGITGSETLYYGNFHGGALMEKNIFGKFEKEELQNMEQSLEALKLLEKLNDLDKNSGPIDVLSTRNPYFTVNTYSCE